MLPELTTERLWLEPRAPKDLEDCLAMDSDIEVRRHITPEFRDNFDAGRYREELGQRMAQDFGPGCGYWVLRPRDEPRGFLGIVLLLPMEDGSPDVEVGWRLPRVAWGAGYASEAARAVLAHGFGNLALDRIVALIKPENDRSLGVARKLGFSLDGTREAFGTGYEQYGLSRKEFEARAGQA